MTGSIRHDDARGLREGGLGEPRLRGKLLEQRKYLALPYMGRPWPSFASSERAAARPGSSHTRPRVCPRRAGFVSVTGIAQRHWRRGEAAVVAAASETGRGSLSWLGLWLHPCKGSSSFSAGVACRDKAEIPHGRPIMATGQHPPSKHPARTTSQPAILYPQLDNRWTGLFVARAGRVSACRVSLLLRACLSHPCLTATSAHRPSPCRGSGQRSLPPIPPKTI